MEAEAEATKGQQDIDAYVQEAGGWEAPATQLTHPRPILRQEREEWGQDGQVEEASWALDI